jgi:hypothetical protein
MTAVNPQITKSFSSGEFVYMNNLMIKGAKYGALLYWFIALTIFIETETILDIWLVETPPFTIIFLRWAILCSIFQALSHTLYIGMLATGNIKKYQITMGSLYLGSFLLCYLLFKFGFGPEYGYISTFIVYLTAVFVRLKLIAQIIPEFSIKRFLTNAILKAFAVIILSTATVWAVKSVLSFGNRWVELFFILLISVLTVAVLSYCIALSREEKTAWNQQIVKTLRKVF